MLLRNPFQSLAAESPTMMLEFLWPEQPHIYWSTQNASSYDRCFNSTELFIPNNSNFFSGHDRWTDDLSGACPIFLRRLDRAVAALDGVVVFGGGFFIY